MPSQTIKVQTDIGGLGLSSVTTATGDGQIAQGPITLAAAKYGLLSTRTDANTGVITTSAPHGISNAVKVDVYWADGRRYNMDTSLASGTVLTIDGGAGDDLPNALTTLTVVQQASIDIDFVGTLMQAYAILCEQRGLLLFKQADGTVLAAIDLTADEVAFWPLGNDANPLDGLTVGSATVTQADNNGTAKIRLGILYDST